MRSEGRELAPAASGGGSRVEGALALALALALFSASVAAQMNDPTRPPASFGSSEPDAGGGGIMLQSVLISPSQKAAIINGVLVKLGEKYGDAVLIAVAENEVVLRGGGGRQVLKLHPGVNMKEIGSTAAAGVPAAGRTQSSTDPAASGNTPAR
jgi:MSHA biogenesis protein MshK